jgi:predicted enzyme related to lactoylglutathione lyase
MKYKGLIWSGLMVEDLESSVVFYKDTLGLPLLAKGDGWAHFDAGNETLLELFSGGKASSEPKTFDQQSIVIGLRVDNLDNAVAELKQKGVSFTGEVDEYEGTRWAHFSDHEGNQLEIKEIR